ncbi:unnamed protein product, partial [Bubo scandiacus]
MAAGRGWRRRALRLLTAGGGVLLTRFPFWHCFSGLLLCAERADGRRKPDIPVPYLYVDMGGGRPLCQLHVLRGEAPLVRPGGRPAARRGHLRRPRRWPRPLRRLVEGPDVFPDHRHHRRLPHPGQRRGRAVPPEATQPLPAVHGASLPRHLPHLPGLLPAAQQGGSLGLPEPPPGGGARPPAPLHPLRPPRPRLPLGLLRAGGGAGAGRAAATRHPPHRRQPGLLARLAPGRVLESDETHRAKRRHFRSRRHLGYRWL